MMAKLLWIPSEAPTMNPANDEDSKLAAIGSTCWESIKDCWLAEEIIFK